MHVQTQRKAAKHEIKPHFQLRLGPRGDVATKKVIELLSSERICNLVVTRMLESLLAGTRVDMELRVRDMACPIYLGMVADTLAPQRYFADERVAALQALCNRIKS